MNQPGNKRKDYSIYIFRISMIFIIAGVIYYKPPVFLFLPLLVSTFVMFLQSKVSRYAFLIGALNSILYGIAHIMQTLYSTALYALMVSFPLQFLTFLNWSKNTVGNKTQLRQMSTKIRLTILGCIVVVWGLVFVIFSVLNSKYLLLDISISVMGLLATILCTLRFKEYIFPQLLSNTISFCTYVLMLKEEPSTIIWVINAANALMCSILAWINMNYREK